MIQKLLASDFFRNSNEPIALEPRAPQSNYPEHTHNFDEIVIVTEGMGRHIINGYPQELRSGRILYINAEDHHLYENVENLHLTNILFQSYNFQYINHIDQIIQSIKSDKNNDQMMNKKSLNTLNQLLAKLNNYFNNPLQKESLLLQILSFLEQNQYPTIGYGNNEEKTKQVLQWLKHHFTQDIDWEVIARQFDVPFRTLYRNIKNLTGYSPQSYITKLKLAEAYYQIRYTNKMITDIAYDCGFNDSGYFSTCFRNEFKLKPSELRGNTPL